MAYKNDSNIAHCGPAHQKSAGVKMMGGSFCSKHMQSSAYFKNMPIVSDQNPDKKGA
jgi:hypothetical protein